MKKSLILTVGTTADPILKAIEEVRPENPSDSITVVLLYGRPLTSQETPTPFDVAHEAKGKAEALGVAVRLMEIDDPEDIDRALEVSRQAFQDEAVAGSDRVIVNFTGGTKVMSAAVVHAALTASLDGELVLDYTGGRVRDEHGRVLREAMRVKRTERTAPQELLRQADEYLRHYNYRDAYILTRRLPGVGRAGFVRNAVEALYRWDEFDYESAVRTFQGLSGSARVLVDDERWGWLARVVLRLLDPGRRITEFLRRVREAQQGSRMIPPDQVSAMALFIADALENSRRRIAEGRPTDSVLRAYRAVEMAVQGRLLRQGVNPWKPDWSALPDDIRENYLTSLQATQPPRDLALTTGLKLLETMGCVRLDGEAQKHLQDVQRSRNFSYLEHGFDRVDADTARRVWDYAVELCERIWGESLETSRDQVRHDISGPQ